MNLKPGMFAQTQAGVTGCDRTVLLEGTSLSSRNWGKMMEHVSLKGGPCTSHHLRHCDRGHNGHHGYSCGVTGRARFLLCCTPSLSSGVEAHKGVLTSVSYLFGSSGSKGQAPSALPQPVPAERLGVPAKLGLRNQSSGFDANLQLLVNKLL